MRKVQLRLHRDEPSCRSVLFKEWIDKDNNPAGTAHPGLPFAVGLEAALLRRLVAIEKRLTNASRGSLPRLIPAVQFSIEFQIAQG
jgi:hypothetical protein